MNTKYIHTPEGVRDIYGFENYKKLKTQSKLQKSFYSYGYREIQTPTFEFLEVYGDEIGTTPLNELYKLFDKDGNIIALRPDFTPSIARCASKYYGNHEIPMRFSYMGNTFTNGVHLQGKLNEVTQIGAELVGDNSIYADAEMIRLAVDAILQTGICNFQVSIGQVDYFKGLCLEMGISKECEEALFGFISAKNFFAADELLAESQIDMKYRTIFSKMSTLFGTVDALQEAKNLVHNEISIGAIEHLERLYEVLEAYEIEQYVSFDLGMLSKYQYYSGIIFKGYTYGIGDAIVTGGRYDGLLGRFGKDAPAIGFVIVVDDLMEAIKSQKIEIQVEEQNGMILYQADSFREALVEQKKLRELGWNIAMIPYDDTQEMNAYEAYAKKQLISHIFYLTEGLVWKEIEVV